MIGKHRMERGDTCHQIINLKVDRPSRGAPAQSFAICNVQYRATIVSAVVQTSKSAMTDPLLAAWHTFSKILEGASDDSKRAFRQAIGETEWSATYPKEPTIDFRRYSFPLAPGSKSPVHIIAEKTSKVPCRRTEPRL